jgi:hypothetical protein
VGLGVASTSVAWLTGGPPTIVRGMNKRLIAGVLWLFAGWYLGNIVAFQLGLSDLLGPVLGIAAAVLVAGDPFGLIWDRAAESSSAPSDQAPSGSTVSD